MQCAATRLGLAATLLAVAALASVEAQAQEARIISLRVMVVQAGPEQGQDDPRCSDMRAQMPPMNAGALKVVEEHRLQLGFGELGKVLLPAGAGKVMLLPINVHEGRLHMQLVLSDIAEKSDRVNTRVRMHPGRPVIVGGPKINRGIMLVRIVSQFPRE
jgi:hypothetical protein